MALMNNPYHSYNSARVNTVSKGDLVVMLYDGAIRFLKEMKSAIETSDYIKKATVVDKVLAIIHELQMSIHYKHNKELANNLNNIYSFIIRQITNSNIKNDQKYITPIFEILDTLKSAWSEAAIQEKTKNRN